jgi:plastocyanin domain-containing protein
MLIRNILVSTVISLSLLGLPAQMVMPDSTPLQNQQFRRLEQPLWLKGTVVGVSLSLIGLELWWFLLSKPKAKQVSSLQGIQEVTIVVEGGYEPSRVVVNAGQPVRLNFLRRDPSHCLEQVNLPDFGIAQNLPLNQTTTVEFLPQRPGTFTFTCGMNMYRGTVVVQAPQKISMSAQKTP